MGFAVSIVSFAACLLAAEMLRKGRSFRFLDDRRARFETLDGIRGFLALAVLFHHFVITYYWIVNGEWAGPPQQFYHNYGKVGVAIFFMITGFLFTSKLLNAKQRINWYKLFESRIFRIVPLYIFALLLITLVVFHNTGYRLDVRVPELAFDYLKWGLFHGSTINGFDETKTIIAEVDWTLRYEWLFYLSLPLLSLLLLKGGASSGTLLFVLMIVLFFSPVDFLTFSTKYFLLFAVGAAVAHLVRCMPIPDALITSNAASTAGALLFLAAVFYPGTLSFIHVVIISLFFALVVYGNSLFGLLHLKSAILLGEISYSIYLLHGFVLYLLFTQFSVLDLAAWSPAQFSLLMPAVSVLVVLFSSLTYLAIEKPLMAYGRRYILTGAVSSISKGADTLWRRLTSRAHA
ncbi:MAG: acyltransferase [Thiohalocapsa sp.]|nr:acyltransferase [Thiohalocapsa sp.]